MATNIKLWQKSNTFSLTLRGHDKYIPLPPPSITDDMVDENPTLNPEVEIQNLLTSREGNPNFNTLYDSFYMPSDCRLTAFTVRLPDQLPESATMTVSFKINGTEIDLFPIPEMEDNNIKVYTTDYGLTIWEDDFVEIDVQISEEVWNLLTWNSHNIVVALAGSMVYSEYAEISGESNIDIGWELGDSYYPAAIKLQNRSGNDVFKNRLFVDVVKSPMSFFIQEVRLSMFEDYIMTNSKFPRENNCFFVDILVNGKNIATELSLPYPTSLDILNNSLRAYNSTLGKTNGYSVLVGDDILIRVYTQNLKARYNGKILEAILLGCSSDSVVPTVDSVSVYELCAVGTPNIAKFTVTKPCVPVKTKKTFNFTCSIISPE